MAQRKTRPSPPLEIRVRQIVVFLVAALAPELLVRTGSLLAAVATLRRSGAGPA